MEIIILGSGGSITSPRIGCECRVCSELRQKNITRRGPCLFIKDIGLLIDTPEDIICSLSQNRINKISAVCYSHWHMDHTAGMRVFENINKELNNSFDNLSFYPVKHEIKLLITEKLSKKISEQMPYFDAVLTKRKYVQQKIGNSFMINGFKIELLKLNELPSYSILISKRNQKVVLCPDHVGGLAKIENRLKGLNLLVCGTGYFNTHLKGVNYVSTDHPLFKKSSFQDTIKLISRIRPKRTIFMHIEEMWNRTISDLSSLEKEFSDLNIEFAYDGMRIRT